MRGRRGYKRRRNETKREKEGDREVAVFEEKEGERRKKRQIEVESGRRRRKGERGMLLPLWSFASSGAAGERFYGRK